MTCLKYYPLCLLTKTVFCLHFIIHDTTAKKKSLVIFFFSAILRIQLLQFMSYAMKALRCNGLDNVLSVNCSKKKTAGFHQLSRFYFYFCSSLLSCVAALSVSSLGSLDANISLEKTCVSACC